MEKLIKENLVYIAFLAIILFGGLYGAIHYSAITYDTFSQLSSKKAEMQTKQEKLQKLKEKNTPAAKEKRKAQSGKVIYEVPQFQFTPEASFGIMFENILANITNSGVKVRSIEYNYKPTDDKILTTNEPGYNACELSFVTVGTYSQLQSFFKNIAKEKYLSSLYEVHIEPYDYDKTILIAKFKIRLYTKSI